MLALSVFAGVGIETLGTYNKDVLDIANRLRALLFVLLLFEKITRIITLAYFLIAAI